MSLAQIEQFFARGEMIRNGVINLRCGYASGHLIAFGDFCIKLGARENKAAADRKVLFFFCDEVATFVPSTKNHAIGVLRKWLVIKDDLIVHRAAGARNGSFTGDKSTCVRLGVDRHAQWIPASETEDDRAVRGMPAASGGKRTTQLGIHLRRVLLEGIEELLSRAHRPNGVRRGRADADGEDVRDANCHS